jgi:PhnB protein
MPLAKQPWGGEVGWLVDKFGISWTVNIQQG